MAETARWTESEQNFYTDSTSQFKLSLRSSEQLFLCSNKQMNPDNIV